MGCVDLSRVILWRAGYWMIDFGRRESVSMSGPPVIPAEKKIRIVLSITAGEVTLEEAARKEKVSEQTIGRWKAELLEE